MNTNLTKLRELLEANTETRGMSTYEGLETLCELPAGIVSKWESGERKMSVARAVSLSNFFDIPANWLRGVVAGEPSTVEGHAWTPDYLVKRIESLLSDNTAALLEALEPRRKELQGVGADEIEAFRKEIVTLATDTLHKPAEEAEKLAACLLEAMNLSRA